MTKKTHSNKKKTKTNPLSLRLRTKRKPILRRALPSLVGFTKEVWLTLWSDKMLFGRLFLATTVASLLLFGATQQDQYVTTTTALNEYKASHVGEGLDSKVQFGIMLTTAATGGLNTNLSESQKVYFFILYLLIWLVTIWLLRHKLAGVKVSLRDGLYNAGAPFVAILALFLVAIVQLLPMTIGITIYSAATSSGLLGNGFETGVFAAGAFLLSVLSVYWLSSTFFAVIVATNPGTYPLAALKAARSIVAGQRARLMGRLLWLAALLTVLWAIVLVPAVLIDTWLAQSFLPVVVLSIQILSGFSIIFASAYIYVLYRRLIDEPAK